MVSWIFYANNHFMPQITPSLAERFTSPPTPPALCLPLPLPLPPWARGGGASRRRRLQERLFGHLAVFLFSIILFIPFLTDCCFILRPNLAILAPFWEPSWGHVGHFFDQNGRAGIGTIDFYVALVFFSDFFAVLTPSWLHFGPILAPFWVFWASSSLDFQAFLDPCWQHSGAIFLTRFSD